jgi:CheY-like chemotaxis protein
MAQILIVDDEAAVRQVIRRWVEDAGHVAREAETAQAALERLAEAPADLAFCDVQMPGEDGIWLTGQIRNKYPLTAVVLATGVSSVPPNVSMQAGVMAYLVKPFNRASLTHALTTALAWAEAQKTKGAHADDRGPKLQDWLDELKDM